MINNLDHNALKKTLVLRENELDTIKLKLNSDLSTKGFLNWKENTISKDEYYIHEKYKSLSKKENINNIISFDIKTNSNSIDLKNINSNLIEDLDAIYFPDKVKMRSNSVSTNNVPKLDFKIIKIMNSKFNQISLNKESNLQKLEDLDPNSKIINRIKTNTTVLNHQKPINKYYVNPNSSKKVIINVENNQDKKNNNFINK